MKKHQVRKIANLMFLYIGTVKDHILSDEEPLAFRGQTAKPPWGNSMLDTNPLLHMNVANLGFVPINSLR